MASNKKLHASIVLGGSISSSLKTAFGSAEGGLKKIGTQITALTKRQDLLSKSIQTFGRQGRNVERMREEYASITRQVDRLTAAQTRLNNAVKQHAKLTAVAGKLQSAGGYMTGAGVAGLTGAYAFGIREAKAYQSELARLRNLGMGSAVNGQAVQFSRNLNSFGTSRTENLTLMRDALSVFGDLDHAKMALPIMARMKFGNEALYGGDEGGENEQKFMNMLKVIELRGGTKSESAFNQQANMVQQVLSATGGRVGPDEWRDLIATGGLAAKSMRNDAFYYQLEPLVQEMGGHRVGTALMSAYNNLYQGHTTKRALQNLNRLGLIADKSKVKHDKSGQISFIDPGALKGANLFRQSQFEWMKQVLIPTLASKGLTTKDQVLDAIGSIFTNRNAANLMATMYLQQQQIEKDERLSRGAANIDQMAKEGEGTAAGRELRARARFHDAELAFGKAMIPIYTTLLDKGAAVLERLTKVMETHPRLAKLIAVGFVGIAGTLAVLGPILIGIGGLLSSYAGYTLLAAKFGGTWTMVGRVFTTLLTPIRMLGNAVLWLGRAIFVAIVENPIGAAITAAVIVLAGAAYEIYRHWGGFKAFFVKLWADVKGIFGGEIQFIKGLLSGDLTQAVEGVKKVFAGLWTFVSDVFKGIGDGIKTVVDDVKSVLHLKSGGAEALVNPAVAGGGKAASLGAALGSGIFGNKGASAAPGAPAIQWNTGAPPAPAMASAGGNASVVHQDQRQVTITIQQRPGESSDDLAKRVARELQKNGGVQQRGMLADGAY